MKTIEVTSSQAFADIDIGVETGGEGDLYIPSEAEAAVHNCLSQGYPRTIVSLSQPSRVNYANSLSGTPDTLIGLSGRVTTVTG